MPRIFASILTTSISLYFMSCDNLHDRADSRVYKFVCGLRRICFFLGASWRECKNPFVTVTAFSMVVCRNEHQKMLEETNASLVIVTSKKGESSCILVPVFQTGRNTSLFQKETQICENYKTALPSPTNHRIECSRILSDGSVRPLCS